MGWCYGEWQSHCRATQAQKAILNGSLKRMTQLGLHKAMNTFYDNAMSLKRSKNTATKFVERLLHLRTWKSWRSWRDWCRFGRIKMLEKALREERLRHKVAETEQSRELERLLAAHNDETYRAEEAWKKERRHLEALLAELRDANQRMKHELYDAIETERDRALIIENEKNREIDKMRGRLSVFIPSGAQ